MPEMKLEFPLVDVHTHQIPTASSKDIIVFAESPGLVKRPHHYQGLYTFGFHPWCADKVEIEEIETEFKERIKDSKLLAFGEMGLDRVCPIDLAMQNKIFVKQIDLCKQLQVPLIVLHSVRAHLDIISVIKKLKFQGALLFHDFNGDRVDLAKLATLGSECFFSLGDNLFRSNSSLVKNLSHLPLQNIFLETDDSTRSLVDVYHQFAEQSGQSMEELTSLIYHNFQRVFGKKIGQ